MNREEWKKKILERIESAARDGRLLRYEDLLALAGDGNPDRPELYKILDEINGGIRGCAPSAIVIDEYLGMPGAGFFRKQRERGGRSSQESFPLFARLARQVFKVYKARENYGLLIDADQVGAETVSGIVGKYEKFIVCRAFGNDPKWGKKRLFKKYEIDFYPTPEEEYKKAKLGIGSATDFRLYAQAVRLVREIHDMRILDVLYIVSCDKGFKHLAETVKEDGIIVKWLDNKGEPHSLG